MSRKNSELSKVISRPVLKHGYPCLRTGLELLGDLKLEGEGNAYYLYQDLLSFVMTFLSITIIGHQFVKADCRRFTPTKAVNHFFLRISFCLRKEPYCNTA